MDIELKIDRFRPEHIGKLNRIEENEQAETDRAEGKLTLKSPRFSSRWVCRSAVGTSVESWDERQTAAGRDVYHAEWVVLCPGCIA